VEIGTAVRRAAAFAAGAGTALAVAGGWLYSRVVRGDATLDLRWRRSFHALGPIVVTVAAPRELVFEQISAPYLGRQPAELRDKLEVIEAGSDMVLAAHHTPYGPFTVRTVETVRFEPPERVHFRHVRGLVPHVVERFELTELEGATRIEYTGELGVDLGILGREWARRFVVPPWNDVVARSLAQTKAGAEGRSAARARRGGRQAP